MKLSFVIVNHHSEQYLQPCIESIYAARIPFAHEIIVVHNEATPSAFSFPGHADISIIEAGANLGFGKANNLAAKHARGEYICFLNSDTELLPGQNISAVLEIFEKDAAVGIVGPRLVGDKKISIPQPWSAGCEITLWDTLRNNFGFIRSRTIWTSPTAKKAAWVSGAALFISKETFDTIGGFDDHFFLYFEDADLCKRLRALGKLVIFFPHYSIFHWSGKSSPDKKTQKTFYYESQDYYFEKHFGKTITGLLKIIRKIFA